MDVKTLEAAFAADPMDALGWDAHADWLEETGENTFLIPSYRFIDRCLRRGDCRPNGALAREVAAVSGWRSAVAVRAALEMPEREARWPCTLALNLEDDRRRWFLTRLQTATGPWPTRHARYILDRADRTTILCHPSDLINLVDDGG